MKKKDKLGSCRRFRQKILIMKLMTVVLFVTFASVSASAATQSITLKVENVSLKSVFKEIKQKSGYTFVFNEQMVDKVGKVSVDITSGDIVEIMEQCLTGTDLGYQVTGDVITIHQKQEKEEGKTIKITGIVKDKDGGPLPGASVIIKGTHTGVATNADGKFEIPVPAIKDLTLVFSFMGMKPQEVVVKNEKPLTITLQEDIKLQEEVIVNGLYSTTKNTFTGSAKTVTQEDIVAISPTNVLKALTVLVPGMRIVENNEQGSNPNNIPEILIRGTTSIAAEGELGLNRPLIVIDGVETTLEALYDMDVFDIDRVDVLKDASATAIYGEKAANGVIVVTRKRVDDPKLKVRYNFVPNIGLADVSSFNLCDPMQKLLLEQRYGMYDDVRGDELFNEKYKRIKSGVNTDWKSIPLRNSWSHSHSVSVTGRGSGMDYGITLRYGDTRGVMKEDYRRNYGIGFYFSYVLAEKLNISFRSDFNMTKSKDSPYGNFSEWVKLNPYDSPYDEYGELIPLLSYNMPNPMYNATTGSFSKSSSKGVSGSLGLRWDIVKGLFFNGNFNLSLSNGQSDTYLSRLHTSALQTAVASEWGRRSVSGNEATGWQVSGVLNYSLPLDEEGSIIAVHAGASAQRSRSEGYSFEGIGFLKPTFNDFNFSRTYPTGHPGGGESFGSSVSFYANANISFRSRYFLDASWRTSGNSVLGKDQRWSPYWSAGIGWNAHNEEFIKNLGLINSLRIRASMGYVGSGNFAGNMSSTVYSYQDQYISGIGAVPTKMGNPDLKSQRTLSLNGGFNLSMLHDRLEVNMDFYKQVSKDLILNIDIPYSTGNTTVGANMGESKNRGWELSVSGVLVKTQDWMWRLTFNTHHTVNQLVKISNSLLKRNEANAKEAGRSPKFLFKEGESSTALYSVRSLGINPATGREIFIKKDGTLTDTYDPQDKVALGDTQPSFEGSSYTSLSYKKFSVGASFSYTWGGYVYNSTRASKVENVDVRQNVDKRAFTERWAKPGDIVAYPYLNKREQKNVHSSRFVEKKNEIYLSSLNFSYTMDQHFLQKIGVKRLALSVGFSDVLRLSTVKFERGTSYPYMKGIHFMISPTF